MLIPGKKSELIRLVKKVLQGTATQKEKEFVEKYYDYFGKETRLPDLSPDEKQALENKILGRINAQIDNADKGRLLSLFENKFFKIVAASLAFIVISGVYFLNRHPIEKNNMAGNRAGYMHNKRYHGNDVRPGGNKAVLTLSNGTRVVLDSAHNGVLANQGNSLVLKMNTGKLVYNLQNDAGKSSLRQKSVPMTIAYNTLTTPRGGEYQIRLPDGTNVWLNSASSLTFPVAFTGKERKVMLKGEAYFEVIGNKEHPFEVQTGDVTIEDLGTHFNVMAYPNEPAVKATLLEGSVKIMKGNTTALLKPGQQAIVPDLLTEKIRVKAVDTGESVAWKNGYFSFNNTSIYEIMRQISRWYDVDVVYQDSLHVFLNGSISRNVDASAVFRMLKFTGEINFIIDGKKVLVKKAS